MVDETASWGYVVHHSRNVRAKSIHRIRFAPSVRSILRALRRSTIPPRRLYIIMSKADTTLLALIQVR